MPRFAANLGYLFAERPMLERFGAAAAAGFPAVELQFPYEQPAQSVRREIERHGLAILGINTPLGGDVFRLPIPASAAPISLDELRESGPLSANGR